MVDRTETRGLAAAPWLALAVGLLLVSNGRWIVPAATWLAPVGMLVFLERARFRSATILALTLFVVVQFVIWWPIIPAPGALYFLIAGLYGIVYFLPFLVHRALVPRLPGALATLAFPLAWVAIEFVFQSWGTPYGSWFSLAYTQAGSLTFLQIASITGLAGLSFMITWFAAGMARVFSRHTRESSDWAEVRRWSLTYGIVLLAVLGYGHLRLAQKYPDTSRIRAAGLMPNRTLELEQETALLPIRRGESITEATLDSLAGATDRLNDDLFRRTVREAKGGAELVAWSETAGRTLLADEPSFLARAQSLASDHGLFLMLGYGVLDLGAAKPLANKVVALDPQGEVLWEFRKAVPIVGAESPFTDPGDGVIRWVEIGGSRVGAVICHDLDFPRLLRTTNTSNIGLMIGPSADWPEILSLHADMAVMRAIENGFSLLRPTASGRSVGVDSFGRRVAQVDFSDDAIVAYLPVRPSPTFYGRFGELFAWICVAGFLCLMVKGFWPSRRRE